MLCTGNTITNKTSIVLLSCSSLSHRWGRYYINNLMVYIFSKNSSAMKGKYRGAMQRIIGICIYFEGKSSLRSKGWEAVSQRRRRESILRKKKSYQASISSQSGGLRSWKEGRNKICSVSSVFFIVQIVFYVRSRGSEVFSVREWRQRCIWATYRKEAEQNLFQDCIRRSTEEARFPTRVVG